MQLRFASLPSSLCLALLTASATCGEPPRVDRYGDPLPPGVVARLGTERLTLNGAVFLAFSPDGRRLAVHNGHDRLRVWEVATGKELLRLTTPAFRGYGPGMTPLVFSPDSRAIALACPAERGRASNRKATVRVWEVVTGKELHFFGDLPGQVIRLAFSPDGRYLFAGGYEVPLLRWDLTEGGAPKKYGDFQSVAFLALSHDGKMLTAATNDKQDWRKRIFARWDVATGKEIGRHALTTPGTWACSLSPEGNFFANPDVDGKSIVLLDPLTGQERSRARESDYPAIISFSADGATMTCSSKDGIVRVWEIATGKLRTRFKAMSTKVEWNALSADGKRLALSGLADNAVHVWDVASGSELHSFIGHRRWALTAAFFKDGKEIVTVSRDNSYSTPIVTWADWSLRRWNAATGDERAVTRADPHGAVLFTTFSSDGRWLATVIHDGTLRLWDVESGKVLRNWKVPTRESTTIWNDGKGGKTIFKTPNPMITQPVFTCDGKMLLAADGSNNGQGAKKIHRWEVATGRELPAFEIEGIEQREFSWCLPSPDGRTLVVWSTGGRYPSVRLVEAANGKVRRQLEGTRFGQNPPAFSPDGRTLAFENFEEVSLWEVASGQPRGRLKGPRWASSLAFSPDGRFLAVGSNPESPVNLWDLTTGQVIGSLRIELGWVRGLAFSPYGSRLAVAGDSPTVLVCDVAALCGKKKMEIVNSTTPTAEELEGLWAELSGTDGARAYRAIRRLGLAGPRAAVFLKARLKGDKQPDERRIARLIAELDDDKFATREKASEELEKFGVQAEPALRRTLEGEVSAEVRRRVKNLLERLGTSHEPLPSPELIRLRAVEALEANGSKEARQALAELSESAMDDQLKREAKASLVRLRSRGVQP